MFCKKCGNELKDGDLFCEKCGTRVAIMENTEGPVQKNKIIVIAIIVVIVFLIGAIAVLKMANKEYTANSSESSIETEKIINTTESTEATTEEITENITAENESNGAIKIGNVEQLYDSDEYNGRTVEITGMVNYESPADGIFKMYGAYSEVVAYLVGSSGYNIPANDCLMVVGVVEKDEYGTVCINVEYAEELGEPI